MEVRVEQPLFCETAVFSPRDRFKHKRPATESSRAEYMQVVVEELYYAGAFVTIACLPKTMESAMP
jgi:hypothetical protein